MTRHESRCTAVCLLFEYSFGGDREEITKNAVEEREEKLSTLALDIYNGVIDNIEQIDRVVTAAVERRSAGRIPRLIMAVLRDYVYETRLAPSPIPVEIAANEAVEICREYGEHEMIGFVNGVIAALEING